MTSREIIKSLRKTVMEIQRKYQKANTSPSQNLLLAAADKIEQLQQIVEDMTNDHYVDILDFYYDRCEKLESDFFDVLSKSYDMCDYCKHYIKCEGKNCNKYEEGVGGTTPEGNHVDLKWSCMDFDFGTCRLLEDTPCNECIENDNVGFEWRGNK